MKEKNHKNGPGDLKNRATLIKIKGAQLQHICKQCAKFHKERPGSFSEISDTDTQTDGRTDRRTDGQGDSSIPPLQLRWRGV